MPNNKLIPLKPKKHLKSKEPIHPAHSLVWFCPNRYCTEHQPFLMQDRHFRCPDCGQPINWSKYIDD